MITVEKLEKGTYFDDAFKISFRYDPTTVAKVKELAERRYLPEDRAWEIPAHELPALIEKVGLSNIKSEEAVVQALNTKEIEDKREATQKRLKGIKPVRDFDFKTAPLPHQIEAFNYGMEKNSLLIGDEQGLGKTKESIDICVARKKELIKTLIVCGVNSVKRYPKDEKPSKDNTTIGVAWEHGIYLGSTLSTTNFKAYKREYGTPEKIEDIYDYRAKLKQKFYFYQDMSKDDDVPKKLQNDFLHQMYEDFGTIEEDCFYDRLEDGKYDEGFKERQVKEEKSR